jgi:PAS domain S-box-containing protein
MRITNDAGPRDVIDESPDVRTNADRLQRAADEVERFRRNLGPFVVAAQTTRMAMVFTAANVADNPIIFANESFIALTKYRREELIGLSFSSLMARGVEPAMLAEVKDAFAGGLEKEFQVRYCRKDGSLFWADVFLTPVRDDHGEIIEYFVSFMDLTKHRLEQDRCNLLIDELNHRVKNTLATVQSIAWQTLRNHTDPEAIRIAIESRLFALSRSHDLLTRQSWEGSGLVDLANAALAPFAAVAGRLERIAIDGANVIVSPKVTLALGIALHELASNAERYGALSNDCGSIRLAWTVMQATEGRRLILRWEETNGPPIGPPSRKGFGSQVLQRGLVHELHARVELDYRLGGLIYTVDVPLAGGVLDE